MARTVRDFVKGMKRRGRTNREVRAVALCTHWNGHPELQSAIREEMGRRKDKPVEDHVERMPI